jgi:membrane protein
MADTPHRSMLQQAWKLLKSTVNDFIEDDCLSMSGALAFYTMFSLPPILIIVTMLVGIFVGSQTAQTQLEQQVTQLVGPGAAQQVHDMVRSQPPPGSAVVPAIIGLIALFFGATGVVVQLQTSLNKIWEVMPDPNQGGVKNFLMKRVLSVAMILGIAFLLLVSLVISTAMTALSGYLASLLPSMMSRLLLLAANGVISLLVITGLFAAMFKILPDAQTRWRDVWSGALVTAILFSIGRSLIGLYLGNTNVASAYGAASSLAVILIWVYYSSVIVFLGAEFTQVWAQSSGRPIEPSPGAIRTSPEKRYSPAPGA